MESWGYHLPVGRCDGACGGVAYPQVRTLDAKQWIAQERCPDNHRIIDRGRRRIENGIWQAIETRTRDCGIQSRTRGPRAGRRVERKTRGVAQSSSLARRAPGTSAEHAGAGAVLNTEIVDPAGYGNASKP